MDYGAIVVGAGHNGLLCAAYLARAGIKTLIVEARDHVGGCAATETAIGGARVNICNCDHVMVRTMPIAEELQLDRYGLRYLDAEPSYVNVQYGESPAWFLFHDIDRTLASIGHSYPSEVENYRRYLKEAMPAARMVIDIAQDLPTPGTVVRKLLRRNISAARAIPTLLSWSKRSVGDVIRSFFTAEALRGALATTGPSVWGVSPDTPSTGLGALGFAFRHSVQIGRPVGGSGALPDAIRGAFEAAGGTVRTGRRVERILCEGSRVRGVALAGGEIVEAPIVVAAGNPRSALVDWLQDPPAAAHGLIERYRGSAPHDGYESKVDAVIDSRYRIAAVTDSMQAALGLSDSDVIKPSMIVSKSLADLALDHGAKNTGRIADRPQFLVQMPSVLDPSVGSGLATGEDVFSLEVLWTPYALEGGWRDSGEPERWLRRFSELVQMPDGRPFHTHVKAWRLMGPLDYERELSMTRGHAPSFTGTPITALLGKDREQTRYETPVDGLFLTGAATFPGAGIWGAPGRNTASAILASDPGRRRRKTTSHKAPAPRSP
jgi:phytoene dehydrogenase-like protein